MAEEVNRALQYMIGVTSKALKLHFKQEDLPGLGKLVIADCPHSRPKELKSLVMDTNPKRKTCSSHSPHKRRHQEPQARIFTDTIPRNGQPTRGVKFQRENEQPIFSNQPRSDI